MSLPVHLHAPFHTAFFAHVQCPQALYPSLGFPLVTSWPSLLKPCKTSPQAQTDACNDSHCTRLDDPAIVHQHQGIGLLQKLSPVGAEDPSFVLENSKNAFPHEMIGYICINGSQGIVQEVKLFLLREAKDRDTAPGPA